MNYTIDINSSCIDALNLINKNGGKGLIILKNKTAIGFITDGDVRRLILRGGDVKDNVKNAMKKDFTKVTRKPTYQESINMLEKGIKIIPIVSSSNEVIEVLDLKLISRIPIHDPRLVGNELKYLTDCIETNWISSQGQYVDKFEKLFSKIHKSMFASSTSSGTSALELTFKAIKQKKDGYVLVPDLTFGATLNAVINAGLKPLICPIKPDDFSLDLSSINSDILSETAAICFVHLYGSSSDINEIIELKKKYDFFIVEDCAEALGSLINNERVGTFGDFSAFSFFGNKLITTGEGGMILCKEEELINNINLLKNHGMSNRRKYWHEVVGTNARMTNIQAAIGLGQLENLEKVVKKKRVIHDLYFQKLKNLEDKLTIWHESQELKSSYWLNTINIKKKIHLENLLKMGAKRNIDFRRCFHPMHSLPAFKRYAKNNFDYRESCLIYDQLICLPSGLNLQNEQINAVCESIIESINY